VPGWLVYISPTTAELALQNLLMGILGYGLDGWDRRFYLAFLGSISCFRLHSIQFMAELTKDLYVAQRHFKTCMTKQTDQAVSGLQRL